ncbi:MAG: cation:proton antiporter, partial [Gallionellaceae bacterium]|nr:cation:proton antiporter [Gallionellaceae bacterium]
QNDFIYDFLALGLIGVVYGVSVLLNAWGFLAVFFAAVALRQTELKLAGSSQQQHPEAPPINKNLSDSTQPEAAPTFSEASLVFEEHLERLSEVVLILLIGGTLFLDSWSWQAVALGIFLFIVVRPISVLLGLMGTRTTWRVRGMVGWFGVRGIGSLYYLMYAIQRGLPEELALQLTQLTLIVVTLSIVAHGTSVKPLMSIFWRRNTPRQKL